MEHIFIIYVGDNSSVLCTSILFGKYCCSHPVSWMSPHQSSALRLKQEVFAPLQQVDCPLISTLDLEEQLSQHKGE